MKIAIVSPYSLEVFGGVQNQVRGLATALSDSADVSVVAAGGSVVLNGIRNVGVGRVSSMPANGSRAPIALSPQAWLATRRALRAIRPDVIHIHEPFVPMVGIAALHSLAVPVVATFHRGGAGSIYPRLAPLLRRDFLRVAERVAVSDEALTTLREVFGSTGPSISVVPNAIDLERFSRAAGERTSTQPVVIFVGRHETRKGLQVLLEAFGGGISDARLEVIGDGPEHTRLVHRFSRPGVVDFLGAIDDESMAQHLANADVLVAPAIAGESFGIVLLEAMAANTAVIASALPGYRLAASDAAQFVAPGDVTELRGALTALLADAKQRESLVAKGAVRAAGHSFQTLATRYLHIYEQALQG